ELERETGTSLLTTKGGLIISSRDATSRTHVEHFFDNTVAAARRFGIAHELIDAAEIRRRFPQFNVSDAEHGYLERDAGFVRPERCVAAHLIEAERRGATIRRNEAVVAFRGTASGVSVTTNRDVYTAATLIIAAGPWLPQLVGRDLGRHFMVYRQMIFWFAIDAPGDAFDVERCPFFIWELTGRRQEIYGFPAVDGRAAGVKIATEQFAETTDADAVRRNVTREEIRSMASDYVVPYI